MILVLAVIALDFLRFFLLVIVHVIECCICGLMAVRVFSLTRSHCEVA